VGNISSLYAIGETIRNVQWEKFFVLGDDGDVMMD